MSTATYNDDISIADLKTLTDFNLISDNLQKRYQRYWFDAVEKLLPPEGQGTKFNFAINALAWKILESVLMWMNGGKKPTNEMIDKILGVPNIHKFNGKVKFKKGGLDQLGGDLIKENVLDPVAFYKIVKQFAMDYFEMLKKNSTDQIGFKLAIAKIY